MRLFVGIKITPNEDIRKVLADTKRLGLRAVSAENLHINLKFLGEVDECRLEQIKQALDSTIGFGGFEIELNSVGAFPDKSFARVIWIGIKSDRIAQLASLVDKELEALGFNRELSYTPHITLARVAKKTDGIDKLFCERGFGFQKVEKIVLVKSTLGQDGPVYEEIHAVSL